MLLRNNSPKKAENQRFLRFKILSALHPTTIRLMQFETMIRNHFSFVLLFWRPAKSLEFQWSGVMFFKVLILKAYSCSN